MPSSEIPHSDVIEKRCPVTGWTVCSRPEWVYAEKGYSIRYEILNGQIFHAITEGYLKEEYVDGLYRMREKILAEMGLSNGVDCYLVNLKAHSGLSYRARLKYIKLFKKHYKQTPFNSYIIYGANRLNRAAFKISSLFMPIKTGIAADYKEAMALVVEKRSKPPAVPAPNLVVNGKPETGCPRDIKHHIEELYIYIGNIDWRKKGFKYPVGISPENPLRPVFDTIDLVKSEVDELFEERQLSENALNQSQEQYRALLGAIPDPVVIYDAQGNATYVNKAFEKVYGWKKEDLLGGRIDFVPPGEVESTKAGWERIIKDGQAFFETRRYTRSGRELDIQASSASLRNQQGEHIASIVIHRDVSERRRAEKTMNQQFKYLSALHQTTLGLISRRELHDLLETIVARSAELVGVPYGFIYLYDEVSHTLTLEVGAGVFKDFIGYQIKPGVGLAGKTWEKGEPLVVNDYQAWEGKDPDARWHQVQVVAGIPIKSKSGIIGVIGVSDDKEGRQITGNEIGVLTRFAQLTSIAIENARLYQQMQQELTEHERTQKELKLSHLKLQEAKAIAEAATLAKSEFLANMSHEIRTPMNAITGFTQLLLETEMSSRQQEYLELIKSSSDILLHLINDILDFSKIEAGKLDLDKKPFKLKEVAESLCGIYFDKSVDSDIELVVDVHPDVPYTLVGDEMRLKQILINLTSNAMKFTKKGEVIVHVKVRMVLDRQITLEFSVKDTGIGINPEQFSRLFDSFAQADASTTRNYGGTGLGLAICKKLVQMMKGEIWVESESGKGSRFIFTALFNLPEKEQGAARLPPVDLRQMKVMVVADHAATRNLLVETLASFTFDVTEFDTGAVALSALLAQADQAPYKMVIVDHELPDMKGYVIARQIKQSPLTGKIPIIMLGAVGNKEHRSGTGVGDVDAFFPKPLRPSRFFDTIMGVFNRSETSADEKERPVANRENPADGLSGLRILLVEDNAINRRLAVSILEAAGIKVDTANDGRSAVETVEAARYDAVLMDIHMPEIDGYVATRIIRKKPGCAEVPIIAMTADAMAGAQEKCIEVGMNDYVSKPIDTNQLFSVLARWTKFKPADRPANGAAGITGSEPTPPDLALKIPGVDVREGLKRLGGNQALFSELLLDFCETYAESDKEIRGALSNDDMEAARRLVHNIKGTAGNLSAVSLNFAAAQLEKGLRQGDKNGLPELLNNFRAALKQLQRSLERLGAGDLG